MPLTEAQRETARALGRSLTPPTPEEGAHMRLIWESAPAPAEQARAS